MEISDENLQTLARYLQETLNPDVNIRRPGKCAILTWKQVTTV